MNKRRIGISIAEVVGIFAMLGVLGAAFVPHLVEVEETSRLTKLRFNLRKLRDRIEDYRTRNLVPPVEIRDAFSEDPVEPIPDNPMSNSLEGSRNRVKIIDSDPPSIEQVTNAGMGGWLYNPHTGGVWPDHTDFLSE